MFASRGRSGNCAVRERTEFTHIWRSQTERTSCPRAAARTPKVTRVNGIWAAGHATEFVFLAQAGLLQINFVRGGHSTADPLSCVSLRSRSPPPHFSTEPKTQIRLQILSVCFSEVQSDCDFLQLSLSQVQDSSSRLSPEPASTSPATADPLSCVSLRSRTPPPHFSNQPETQIWKQDSDCDIEELAQDPSDSATAQILGEHKKSLRSRCDRVTEGFEGAGDTASLSRIYTELYITQTHSKDDQTQHELTRLEAGFKQVQQETPIRCPDIFTPLPCEQKLIRGVMTVGVAGVGKTFSVLKFCVDWAQGSENQDVDLVLPLSFRELNLVCKGESSVQQSYSLLQLVKVFHPSLQPLSAHTLLHAKVLFIFDGLDESRLSLDESRLSLDFNCKAISEVTVKVQKSEVSLLLVNLIRGNLLPDALIWITSRPAAVNHIPAQYVHRLTEVRGFRDSQKKEYFQKRFSDVQQQDIVLTHITGSRSLHSMCQIPVFCWITATVLNHMLRRSQSEPLPQTLTDMYAHFLLVQTQRKRKYIRESGALEVTPHDCEFLLKLGRLAFNQLQKGNLMFYQEDLQKVGLDISEASVHSGLCTEILKEESIIFEKSVYCFVHLSVQEFLAAVYMFHCFNHNNAEEIRSFLGDWEENMPLDVFLLKSLEKSFENKSGSLDLFVRFLHGLLQESNLQEAVKEELQEAVKKKLLRVLLGPVQTDSQTIQKIIHNLKEKNTGQISANGSITVFCCLTEMNDHSVHQQMLEILKTEFESDLSEFHCQTLAHKLQMPQEVLEELDIKRFRRMPDGKLKLVPPDTCREATILWNGLSKDHAAVITSALKSGSSGLKRLDLWLRDADAVEAFCEGLMNPNCRLETLSLHHSRLLESSCSSLASALNSNPSHLRKLDLSWNEELQDPGVSQICAFLQNPECHLDILRLENCRLGKDSCSSLSSALTLNPFHLRELDVTENPLSDAGVEYFCEALKTPGLKLEHLRLDNCSLSDTCCSALASALIPVTESNLKKLDLSVNEVKDSGVELLCEYLRSPSCRLEAIELKGCGLTERSCAFLASSLNVHMKDLRLNWNPAMKDRGVENMSQFITGPSCGLEVLRFRGCGVSGLSCSALASALKSVPGSPLRELDLCENSLTQSDVEALTDLLQDPQYRLEKLEWEEN
ncbi:hypothetical protein WMY93_012914 [Mugilogobius chulae]|uniref:NACHT domain-containing protein n=1 Tax=Mugilogobius chulae TaxID=88201 RepID=A0AAW0NYJ6_9GOBI